MVNKSLVKPPCLSFAPRLARLWYQLSGVALTR